MSTTSIEHVTIDGVELAYSDAGAGEPLVAIHGGLVADAFAPTVAQPELASGYRVIRYHRRGYGESARSTSPVTTEQQAADCLALMHHLGIVRAHLAGYSYGGSIALQLALDAPQVVQSLALFEPLVPAALADPAVMQFFADTAGASFGVYATGDKAGAIDTFAQGAFGPGYRGMLEAALPGAAERMVTDADAVFGLDLPAIPQWGFGPEQAARVTTPTLLVYHDDARWAGFRLTHQALRQWLPQTEERRLDAASHLLQMVAPRESAVALASFLARHPLPTKVGLAAATR